MARSLVCISFASGAGAEEISRMVAYRLGFFFVDEQIVWRAAKLGGIDPQAVSDEERRKSLIEKCLENLATSDPEGLALGHAPSMWDEPRSDTVRSFIRDAIREVAEQGDTVIGAHAASHLIGPGQSVLRVLVTASVETRAQRLKAAERGDDPLKTIKQSDAARADYLKRFYGIRQELPTQYDLVINTDTLSVDQAIALIVQAATPR